MKTTSTEQLLRHFVEEDAVLRSYVHACTRNHQDADDVIQDIWRTLATKLDQYDDSRPFRPWAMGVARLQVLKWRQSKARSREILSGEVMDLLAATAEESADEIDMRLSFIKACLKNLTMASRNIVEMKYMLDLRAQDIAERIGRNVAAVEMSLVRSRRTLRDCIEEQVKMSMAAETGRNP